MPSLAPKSKNLIPVPRAVERAGKTFTQTYWVKAQDVGLEKEGFQKDNPGGYASQAAFRKVVDKLAGKGAGAVAEEYTRSWTGGCKDKHAARAMGTVAALLGMESHVVEKLPFVTLESNGPHLVEQYKEALKNPDNQLRKVLMATYAATQEALAGEADVIRLQRGASAASAMAMLTEAKKLADQGVHYDDAAITMRLNPLNCMTTSAATANKFGGGGVVFTLDVPKSAVLFSYKSTPGHSDTYSNEQEYTVMCQGPTAVSLRNISGKVGQEIYNYFAARGLTGDQKPKEAPPTPKVDPLVPFKVGGLEGKPEALKELQGIVEGLGGKAATSGFAVPASKMAEFTDKFAASSAYDPAKPVAKMKAWLTGKAATALSEAQASVAPPSEMGLGMPTAKWRSEEPTKAVGKRITEAVLKAQAALEAAGVASMGSPAAGAALKAVKEAAKEAAGPKQSGGYDELEEAIYKSTNKLFGGGPIPVEQQGLHEEAMGKALDVAAETGSKAKAVAAYEEHMHSVLGKAPEPTGTVGLVSALEELGGAAEKPTSIDWSATGQKAYEHASEHFVATDGNATLVKGHFGKDVLDLSPEESKKHVAGLTAKDEAMLQASKKGLKTDEVVAAGINAYSNAVKAKEPHQIPAWAQPSDEKLTNFSSSKGLVTQWAWAAGHGSKGDDTSEVHPDTKAAVEAGVAAINDAFHGDMTLKEAHAIATKAMNEAMGKGGEAGWHPSDVEEAKAAGASVQAPASSAHPGHVGEVKELPKLFTPTPAELEHKGKAVGIGGAGEKHFYESSTGKKWLAKVAAGKGTGAAEPFKAEAQVFASKLGQIIKPGSVEVGHFEHAGKPATVQPWLGDNVKTLKGVAPSSLTDSQKADVAKEHVVDWLTGNHDSHAGNLVVKADGQVVGVDKEQAFKHSGKDKLSVDYHPNAEFGEEEPYYNKFWKAFADGKMDFDPKVMKSAIDAAAAIPNAHYVKELKPYAEAAAKPGKTVAQIQHAAVQKKMNLQKDFEKFISGHYEKRTGKKGTFTFDGGWQPEGAPKPEAAPKPEPKSPAAKVKAQQQKAAEEASSTKAEAQAAAEGQVEKLPDATDEQLKTFFEQKAGETPPHRKWYWKKWAEAAMNKAKIPKEEQPEVWKKVLAQGKVMLAKKTLAGQKVSEKQHEAYIKAQAAKKGATPDLMPVVHEVKKEKLKMVDVATGKSLHAEAKQAVASGTATEAQKALAAADPESHASLKEALKSTGHYLKGEGPEHPYQYYWKSWANAAAKEATGAPASSDVHEKISGLAKKFVAEKQTAGVKFTGKDLEKFIKAAAKKGGEHPGQT